MVALTASAVSAFAVLIGHPRRIIGVDKCQLKLRAASAQYAAKLDSPSLTRRTACLAFTLPTHLLLLLPTQVLAQTNGPKSQSESQFYELEACAGIKVLDIRQGTGPSPQNGDKVVIHYYGRLAAKQGWRFDSTYDHKDETGTPVPFVFTVGSGTVISGLDLAVRTMKVGGLRRIIIPPSQGYQNTSQEPIPPNIFDRQRLFTTIFNPTRLANGEGSTLGTLIFDVELLGIRQS